MGIVHIMERGGDDYRAYKKAVKAAKEAIDTICDLTSDMEEEYGYSARDRHEDIIERDGKMYKRVR